jgi:hypothetical protein
MLNNFFAGQTAFQRHLALVDLASSVKATKRSVTRRIGDLAVLLGVLSRTARV